MRMRRLPGLAVALLLGSAAPAAAQEPQDRWTGALTVYGWLTAIGGDISANRSGRQLDFTYDVDQVLSNLDFAAFASLEVRRGRLGLLADVIYAKFSHAENIPGNLGARASGDLEMGIVTGAAAWRFYQAGTFFADVLAGGRLYTADVSVATSRANPRPDSRSEYVPATWFDPLVGLRLGVNLTDKLALKAYGTAGGFSVGSDSAWELYGGATYAFTPTILGELGYRYLTFDYQADRAKIDVRMHGLALGVTFGF